MKNKTYLHYLLSPVANFQLHLYVFEYSKVDPGLVWNQVFNSNHELGQYIVNYGVTYAVKDHSLTTVAFSLMRDKDNSIDLDHIVHEVTHVCDEIFQIMDMKFGSEYGSYELRAYLAGSITCKVCQILRSNKIKVSIDRNDKFKLNNVIKL